MVRQLYRIYLYVVSLALLVFAAVGFGALLDIILAFTPLRGSYRPRPTGTDLTQQIVFAAVAWLIAGALGALHYRLIRRDIAADPTAGPGAVRAFFLNLAQLVAVLIAVFAGAGAFDSLAYQEMGPTPDTASSFAVTITALLVAVLLQFERSRTRTAPGLATTFQRLHLYGVPLVILLAAVAGAWDSAIKTTLDAALIQAKLYNPVDPRICGPFPVGPVGPIEGVCALPNAGFLWLATLFPLAVVAAYAFLVRGDTRSILRAVAHLASFGAGVAFVLVGLDRAVELALRALFGVSLTWSEIAHPWNAPYNFVSPATFGALLLVVYGLWLRAESAQLPLGEVATALSMYAVAAALLAIPFYWGLGRALDTAFERFAGSTAFTYPTAWAAALALMVTGLGYIPLSLRLRAKSEAAATAQPSVSAPWRALVLALLAGGIVTGAVGLAVALYALGTNLLGAPLADWERTARAGAAALIVGVVLAGIYGWIALHGRFVEPLVAGLGAAGKAPPKEAAEATEVTEPRALVEAIEAVLDEYAAHHVEREQAAERILELTHP